MDTTSDAGVNHKVMDNDPAMASLFPKTKHLQDEGIYMNRKSPTLNTNVAYSYHFSFTTGFYASPVCTPSRKQILSGRYVYSQGNGLILDLEPHKYMFHNLQLTGFHVYIYRRLDGPSHSVHDFG